MLEWMHDEDVVKNLKTNFRSFSINNCISFIERSETDKQNIHLAIVDENDEYQGTVSLKNIHEGTAEFAITIRKSAMGKGISSSAMREILDYGKNTLGLKYIYWCVSSDNKRAVRFYRKNGYQEIDIKETDVYSYLLESNHYEKQEIDDFLWFKY